MIKALLFLSFVSATIFAHAQHSFSWSFRYRFRIEHPAGTSIRPDSLSVLVSVPFNSEKFSSGTLTFDTANNVHVVQLNYETLQCCMELNHPPTVLIQVFLTDHRFDSWSFTCFIPVSFDEIARPEFDSVRGTTTSTYDFGTIDLTSFLHGEEQLAGIHVTSEGIVHFYKKGERAFPLTTTLIHLPEAP